MTVRGFAALAVLTLAATGCKRARRGTIDPARPPPAPGEQTVFALHAGEDESLTFPIETTRTAAPAGRRLRLLLGRGEATLTLFDPADPKGGDVAFGRGELEATDRARGAAFVAGMASWLGRRGPPTPRRVGELRPASITYARIGTDGSWECNKLFFSEGELEAELYLNVRFDGKQARFVEKDEAYREPLLALLGASPRGGKPVHEASDAAAR